MVVVVFFLFLFRYGGRGYSAAGFTSSAVLSSICHVLLDGVLYWVKMPVMSTFPVGIVSAANFALVEV